MSCRRSTTAAPKLLARNCDTGLHFRIEVGRQAIREDEQADIITSPWAAIANDRLAKPTTTTAIGGCREESWCEGGDFPVVGLNPANVNSRLQQVSSDSQIRWEILWVPVQISCEKHWASVNLRCESSRNHTWIEGIGRIFKSCRLHGLLVAHSDVDLNKPANC